MTGGDRFKTKSYWKLVPGEVFKSDKLESFMRLNEGSIGLDNNNRGCIRYFDGKEEVFELWSQQIELRGIAIVNEFGDLIGEVGIC